MPDNANNLGKVPTPKGLIPVYFTKFYSRVHVIHVLNGQKYPQVDPNNPWLAVGNVLSEQTEAASEKAASEKTALEKTALEKTALEKTALENPVDDSSPDKAVEVPNDDVVSEERSDESNSSENKTVTNSGNKETNSPAEQARNDGKKPLKDGPNIDQETLVDMAFANDDVVAQFVEEKEKTLDAETDKVRFSPISCRFQMKGWPGSS